MAGPVRPVKVSAELTLEQLLRRLGQLAPLAAGNRGPVRVDTFEFVFSGAEEAKGRHLTAVGHVVDP